MGEIVTKKIIVENIISISADYFGLKVYEIIGSRRFGNVVDARHIVMTYLWQNKKSLKLSLKEIGNYFGGRDHTSVLHAKDKVLDRFEIYPDIVKTYKKFKEHIDEDINGKTENQIYFRNRKYYELIEKRKGLLKKRDDLLKMKDSVDKEIFDLNFEISNFLQLKEYDKANFI